MQPSRSLCRAAGLLPRLRIRVGLVKPKPRVATRTFLPPSSPIIPIELKTLFYSSATLRIIATGIRTSFEAMNRSISEWQLRPVVAQSFSFETALEALHHYEQHSPFGKVVITIDA